MKYYEKTIGKETFVMCIDERCNYSVASNLDPDPDGFWVPQTRSRAAMLNQRANALRKFWVTNRKNSLRHAFSALAERAG